MKNKITALILVLMLFSGVAVASSLNGSYQGEDIVKVTSNGKVLAVEDVPATIHNDRTVVPIIMLKQLGLDVKWDETTFGVDVTLPKAPPTDMRDVLAKTGGNLKYETIGSSLYATVDFAKKQGFEADWNEIYGIFINIANLSTDYVKVNYVDGDKVAGTVAAKSSDVRDVVAGKITGDQMLQKWILTGDVNAVARKVLSSREIAKLIDHVAFVDIFDNTQRPIGTASGFMITDLGLLITNSHVGHNSGGLRITLGGETYNTYGEFVFDNPMTDLYGVFVLYDKDGKQIEKPKFPYLPMNTNLPEIGDKVYLIGSPKGFANTVTQGIVSGIRTINGVTYIQHTAESEPGSSGGALLNEYGEVIGVHSWVRSDGTSLKFAIPMKYVQDEIDKQTK